MNKRLVDKLLKLNYTVSAAESCTGGMIASQIVSVPGSSGVLNVSFVTYANEAKVKYLGVKPETIDKYGVVSEEVAREMAIGLRDKALCDVAIVTTGIAGPGGGTDINPVGTVYIAVSANDNVYVQRYVFDGDRDDVRIKATNKALEMAIKAI